MMPATAIPQQDVQAIVQRSHSIMATAAAQSAPSWVYGKPLSAEQKASLPKLNQQGKSIIEQYAQTYAAQSETPEAKAWLRTHVKGVPVVPPNLRGKAAEEYVDHTLMSKEERSAKTLVFISMDMPPTILRHWFAVVANNRKLFASTVFVLRGWPDSPTGLPDIIREVNRLMPSFTDTANVEINPLLFSSHKVNVVPVIIHQTPKGKWGSIVGDQYGIRQAIRVIDEGKGSPTHVFGHVWKIAEPNMVQVFQQKIKTFNWKAAEEKAKDNAWSRIRGRLQDPLPDSQRGRQYTFNPSVVANRTIRLPNGRVLVRKGQVVDPLTAFPFPWTQSYIVFNPAEAWQVRQVEAWVSLYPNVVIMATQLPGSWTEENRLVHLFGRPVYGFYPHLAHRLGVVRVPSLVRPDGPVLSIIVPKKPLGDS
jgi:conjugal transfer pilus assembly protein TraW